MKKQKKKEKKSKKKINFSEVKKSVKYLLKASKQVASDNKLLVVYIIGAVINGIILRAFTIHSVFAITPFLGDLIISIIFASLYFLIKKRYRFLYLIIISLVSTLVCLSNIVYYFYYNSFISITFFSFALTNGETGDSNVLGDLLQIKFFIFLWFPLALCCFHKWFKDKSKDDNAFRRVNKKKTFKVIYSWALIFFIIFLTTLKPVDFSRLYSQWNREYLVSRFGVYMYQINDIVKSVEPKMATLFGKDKANREIDEFYENKTKEKKNDYSSIFKGKNVIAVHAESMQQVLINMKINGKEVTPNLNKLTQEGLYFDNFYSQVSFGTSSDTEFTIATSVLPVSNGTVFINYANRTYVSMYDILRDKGYYTFSMHANTGDFWNRNIMHQNLGYDKFYDKASYKIDEQVGFGLSDHSFIKQSVDYIKQINKEHKKFYGTLITLSNHTPFDYDELFGKFDVKLHKNGVTYPYMDDTKLGNYFISAHYADKCLGELVTGLDEAGLLDDTIIMIYGDHDARISTSAWDRFYNYDYKTDDVKDEDDPTYKELDYYWQEVNRRVPFIIWSKDEEFQNKYAKTIHTTMGMYDVAPTLLNMLGTSNKYALGSDIMNKTDNLVVFPNSNFVTNYVYYNDNSEEYKLLKNIKVTKKYIYNNKEKANKLVDISNDIIVYDYFGNKFSDNYKEE